MTNSLAALLAVTNGNPAPNNLGDPQVQNPSGTSFPLNGGALVIGEVQYSYPALGGMVATEQADQTVHPGTVRLGFWYNTENFDDLFFDNQGLSLASPRSSGMPLSLNGNYSFYAVIDQTVWQSESGSTLSAFGRAMGTPQSDRNPVTFGLNAGLTLKQPFPGRGGDTAGLAMGYAKVSGSSAALAQQTALINGTAIPPQTGETFIELTYQYQLTPAVQLQPDFQYVFNPGAGVVNPNNPNRLIQNEAVLGVRAIITF